MEQSLLVNETVVLFPSNLHAKVYGDRYRDFYMGYCGLEDELPTKYGMVRIKYPKYDDKDPKLFEFKFSFGPADEDRNCCSDGDLCRISKVEDDCVTLVNVTSGETFRLTMEELSVATKEFRLFEVEYSLCELPKNGSPFFTMGTIIRVVRQPGVVELDKWCKERGIAKKESVLVKATEVSSNDRRYNDPRYNCSLWPIFGL